MTKKQRNLIDNPVLQERADADASLRARTVRHGGDQATLHEGLAQCLPVMEEREVEGD